MKDNFDYSRAKDVSIEVDGKIINGHYQVHKGVLTLNSEHGRKSTQLGSLTPESLAKLLLRELHQKN